MSNRIFIPSYLKDKKIWLCRNIKKEPVKINGQAYKGYLSDKELYNLTDCIEAIQSKAVAGLGIRIESNIIAGIDIDNCIDSNGNVSDMAKDIIDTLQSYTEFSPSGKGIHILFKAESEQFIQLQQNNYYYQKNSSLGLEIYFNNRYLTFTGKRFNDYDISDRTEQVKTILDRYMIKDNLTKIKKESLPAGIDKRTVKRDLKKIIVPKKYLYESDFIKLFLGDTEAHKDKSESELDMLLLGYLCRYTDNPKHISFLFTFSNYYQTKDKEHKEKWNRLEKETIDKVRKNNKMIPNINLLFKTREETISKIQKYLSVLNEIKMDLDLLDLLFKGELSVSYDETVKEYKYLLPDSPYKNLSQSEVENYYEKRHKEVMEKYLEYGGGECFLEYELELKWHLIHIDEFFKEQAINLPIPQNNTANNLRKGLSKGIATGVQLRLSEEQSELFDGFIKDRGIEILIKQYADKHDGINANSVIRLQDFFQNKWLENVLQLNDKEMQNFNENVNSYTKVVANINEYLDLRKLAHSDQNKKNILKEIEFLTDIKYKIKNAKGTQGLFLPLIRRLIRCR